MYKLTEEEKERYSRQLLLDEIGVEGQCRIHDGRVLVVGAGGLGSPILLYLAAAGVGTIGIVDGDVVDRTNLQRQVIHRTADLGRAKVISAAEKMRAINPNINVIEHQEFMTATNALQLIDDYDFIIDATDNFAVKFLINDACILANKPFSHGGILRLEGQTFTHLPGTTCFRCLFKEPPPTDFVPPVAGVLGSAVGVIGTIQATEALKYLGQWGQLLTNQLLTFNAPSMTFRKVNIKPDPKCAICSPQPTITSLKDYDLPLKVKNMLKQND